MKYYLPSLDVPGGDSDSLLNPLVQRLLGLDITPHLAWSLTPWSWLIDWYTGVGNMIANMQSLLQDSLVAKYAYIMRHRRVTHNYLHAQPFLDDTSGTKTVRAYGNITLEVKERAAASPFGFGLGNREFSDSQAAILAALGLSRLR